MRHEFGKHLLNGISFFERNHKFLTSVEKKSLAKEKQRTAKNSANGTYGQQRKIDKSKTHVPFANCFHS